MADHEAVIDAMASVKGDVKRRTDEAIAAILLLAWAYRQEGFAFEDYPELDERVNKLLQSLSDGNLSDAEKRTRALLESLGLEDWNDESLAYAEREIDGENALWRLDLHASHLKELLAGWIAVAAAQKLSLTQTRLLMNTYGGTPWLSKKWRDSGLGKIGWGGGYQRDVVGAMTVIGQDLINRSYQYAKLELLKRQGVTHYRTIRGSTYDCPLCDEMMEKRWQIDEIVLPYHPRCVCIPVPITEVDDEIEEARSSGDWELTFRDPSGGYVLTEASRIKTSQINKQEMAKYEKEKDMCIVLARNGYRVRHLGEKPGRSSSDILLNGEPADLKQTGSANNIAKYAKKATQKQGASAVVFEFTNENQAIHKEVKDLKKSGYKIFYWFKGKNKVIK